MHSIATSWLLTQILQDILSLYKNATFTQKSTKNVKNLLLNSTWHPTSETLLEVTSTFANHATILNTSINPPTAPQLLEWWIFLLPGTIFQHLHTQHLTKKLHDHWKNTKVSKLVQATEHEITVAGLAIPQKKKKKNNLKNPLPTSNPNPNPSPASDPSPTPASAPSQPHRPYPPVPH